MPKSLFNKVAGQMSITLLKETQKPVFSYEFYKIFNNTFLTGHPWMTASSSPIIYAKVYNKNNFYRRP